MTIMVSTPVKKREVTSGTKEWADHNVNCIKGCQYNCRYCYAKLMAKRFGRCTESTWKDMVVSDKSVERGYKKYNGRVMFPSTHDIIDEPEFKAACFTVIGKLLDAGNEVLITTKPSLSITNAIMEQFHSHKTHFQFRFTITSLDDSLLSFWEPNAPSFEDRFTSLQHAYENDFKTSVSIEPFLDHTPQTLIDMLSPFVSESIWLGPMNYIAQNGIADVDKSYYENIRNNSRTERLWEIYHDLKDNPIIRFKDSMNNRLGLV